MAVQRIAETPRVTKPFSDEQWAAIDTVGLQVDADLVAQDVRLTMGGEPTFISLDDPQGDEWNTAAVGPTKERLAYNLARRLAQRLAPQGLLTYGQGKWYPGSPCRAGRGPSIGDVTGNRCGVCHRKICRAWPTSTVPSV